MTGWPCTPYHTIASLQPILDVCPCLGIKDADRATLHPSREEHAVRVLDDIDEPLAAARLDDMVP